jgi:hypothetical protein
MMMTTTPSPITFREHGRSTPGFFASQSDEQNT